MKKIDYFKNYSFIICNILHSMTKYDQKYSNPLCYIYIN